MHAGGRTGGSANHQAIGGLLLPKKLVSVALEPYLVPTGSLGALTLDEKKRGEAERALAEIFDVNPVVARLRIGEIYRPSQGGQLML